MGSDILRKIESLKKANDQIELSGLANISESILDQIVLATIHKFEQKLLAGVQDSVTDLLDNFKQQVADLIFKSSWQWQVKKIEPQLFPRNCRFYYTKGNKTCLIIEREPEIRSLLMDRSILGSEYNVSYSGSERLSLSLPYNIFVFLFENDVFQSVYMGWRNKPLNNLRDYIHTPYLPNIHVTCQVCLGDSFGYCAQQSVAEQVDEVLTYFWNSTFNNDLSEMWWRKANNHPNMTTAYLWADQSVEDPNFVLNMPLGNGRELNDLLRILTQDQDCPDENTFRHNLSETIDQCSGNLFNKIMRFFKKTKFESFYPKDVRELLEQFLKQGNNDLIELVLIIKHELDKLQSTITTDFKNQKPVAVSKFWTEYSELQGS